MVQEKTYGDAQRAITKARPMFSKIGKTADTIVKRVGKIAARGAKSHGQDFLDPVSTKFAKAAHKYHTGPIAKKARENPNQYAKMQARTRQGPKEHQSEGWLAKKVQKERDKLGAQAAGTNSKKSGPPIPRHKPKPPKPSIIGAIKDVVGRLFNGDFIGMTAYLNTLNEDQSSDQIAVVIGDINETELTLINPENLDQTTKINLENLQVDINEDGELEIYEAVDPKQIPIWNPRKGGGRTGQKPPLK